MNPGVCSCCTQLSWVKCNTHLYSLSLVCKTNNSLHLCFSNTHTHRASTTCWVWRWMLWVILTSLRSMLPFPYKTCTHTLLIQHCVDEDWSHRLAGVTVFYRCKVTCLCMNTKHAGVDLRLHTPLWLCMIIFTFSKQFLCPGTEPLTYSTLYLVLTLHIWKRDRQRRGRWKNIELKLQARTTKFKTKALCVYVCVCVYLQSISSDVDVAHLAGHLLPFENFSWILEADDEYHTCSY